MSGSKVVYVCCDDDRSDFKCIRGTKVLYRSWRRKSLCMVSLSARDKCLRLSGLRLLRCPCLSSNFLSFFK